MTKLRIRKVTIQHTLAVISLVFGGVLLVTGSLNGNHAAIQLKLKPGASQTVSISDVDLLKKQYPNQLRVVEFADDNRCTNQIAAIQFQKCYSTNQLLDLKWTRKTFSTAVKRPLVIYSQDKTTQKQATDLLTRYGYQVNILAEDATG